MREIKKILADGNVPSHATISLMTSCKTTKITEKISTSLKAGTEHERGAAERKLYAKLYEDELAVANPVTAGDEEEQDTNQLFSKDQEANAHNKIVNGGVNFNESFRLCLKVPHNKSLCPVLEVTVHHFPWGKCKPLGTGTYSLASALAWFYGDEDNDDYKKKWKEFFQINQKKGEDDKEDKPKKIKVPKVKAENQLLYMDDLVYEMPPEEEIKSKKVQKKENWRNRFMEMDAQSGDEGDRLLADQLDGSAAPRKDPSNMYIDNQDKTQSKKAKKQEKRQRAVNKHIAYISEFIGDEDLANLDEHERKLIVEDLIDKGYIQEDGSEDEEDYEEEEDLPNKSRTGADMAKSNILNEPAQPGLHKENSQLKASQPGISVDGRNEGAPQGEKFDLDLQEKPASDAGNSDKVEEL